MNEINMLQYEVNNSRKKRIANEDEYEKIKQYEENKKKNMYNDDQFMNIENLNSFNFQSDNEKNKYPDFQSFLQIHPKEDVEIPSIKYYNYIFNIGSPFN